MYFTQEDLRKIESWLYNRAIKDTDFPNADPMDGSEQIPIIQDGKNKTLKLYDFIKQISDMRLPDFYNITVNTKKSCITLSEAIE